MIYTALPAVPEHGAGLARLRLADGRREPLTAPPQGHGNDTHPRIEVRLFNPFPTRGGLLSRFAAAALDIDRIHRRMHNKLLIVDGALAIVGGRNLGDGYFQASDRENFFDLDAVVAGAVVPQLASLFDID